MIIISLAIITISAFVGYVIGRIGDYYINFWMKDPNWTPDHWIYGLIMMIVASLFLDGNWEIIIFSFGAGVLISDLKDFLNLKFYGSDNKTKETRRFWHID